jgi:hypothetical protein
VTTAQTNEQPTSTRPGWAQRLGLNALVVVLSGVVSFWSAQGWAGVAKDWLGITGWDAYLLFGMFEGVIVVLVLIATRTRLAGDAAGILWLGVWLLTGQAVTVQVLHALGTPRPYSALLYGTATLVVVLLWQLKTRQSNRVELRKLGLVADPAVSLGLGLWLRFPRWAWRAQTVARWDNLSKPADAMRRAQELYPIGNMPWDKAHAREAARLSKAASRGRGKTASQGVSKGASKGTTDQSSKATSNPTSPTASKGVVRAARHAGVRPTGKGPTSTALLTKARTFAIAHREKTGRLPGVEPIRKHLNVGQDTAKDLRNQVHAELSNGTDQYAAQ